MNYMAEVAKMLGVELGEKFKIKGYSATYILDEDGLFDQPDGMNNFMHLTCLLTGEFEVVRIPWTPCDNEKFYVVLSDGDVRHKYWDDCATCKNYYKLGNCYSTKEEAETNRDKWLSFYASDEILEV